MPTPENQRRDDDLGSVLRWCRSILGPCAVVDDASRSHPGGRSAVLRLQTRAGRCCLKTHQETAYWEAEVHAYERWAPAFGPRAPRLLAVRDAAPLVLINGLTFSAGEFCTEMLKQLPNVTALGDTTGGGSVGGISAPGYSTPHELPSGKRQVDRCRQPGHPALRRHTMGEPGRRPRRPRRATRGRPARRPRPPAGGGDRAPALSRRPIAVQPLASQRGEMSACDPHLNAPPCDRPHPG